MTFEIFAKFQHWTWYPLAGYVLGHLACRLWLWRRGFRSEKDVERLIREAHVNNFMREVGMPLRPLPRNPSDSHCATTRDGGEM